MELKDRYRARCYGWGRDGLVGRAQVLASLAVVFFGLAGCTSLRDYFRNGCKVGPNYAPPDALVAPDWIDSHDPRLDTSSAAHWAWWANFHDPVLDALIYDAYHQNLSLYEAGYRVLQVKAERGIAFGTLFPQAQQGFGSYTRINESRLFKDRSHPDLTFSRWEYGGLLAWEVDFWGRFRRGVEAANAELDVAIAAYDDAVVILLAEVAQTYVEIRTLQQRLDYAHQNIGIQQSSLDVAEERFKAGLTNRADVTQARANVAKTRALVSELELFLRQANNRLCVLLALPPQELKDILCVWRPLSCVPADVAVGIPADLLRRRPDVRRAEREVAAQCPRIGIAESDLYPAFRIHGTIAFTANQFKDVFNHNAFGGAVGPSFQWNILNYGRIVHNVRAQDAIFQQRVMAYQHTVLKANAEAEDAIVAFQRRQEQANSLRESVEAARESVDLARSLYRQVKADFNRVFTAEVFLASQQDDLAKVEGLVASSLVQVYKALGGGWEIQFNPPYPHPPADALMLPPEVTPPEQVPPPGEKKTRQVPPPGEKELCAAERDTPVLRRQSTLERLPRDTEATEVAPRRDEQARQPRATERDAPVLQRESTPKRQVPNSAPTG